MSVRQRLLEAFNRKQLVRAYCKDGDRIDGRVISLGQEFFALGVIGHDIWPDGVSCPRYSDITGCEVPAPKSEFYEEALRLRRATLSADGLDLTSVATILTSISAAHTLVTIRVGIYPNECYIGAIARLTGESVFLKLVTPDAEWEPEETEYKFSDIVRIEGGGAYEEALLLVAKRPS